MSRGHSHPITPESPSTSRLRWVLVLTSCYLLIEFVGGIMANSLALLSDALHMLSDVAALTLAMVAIVQMRRPPDTRRSYGYQRLEIVSALANGIILCGISVVIVYEAVTRLRSHQEIRGAMMLVIAAVGLGINLAGIALLRRDSRSSLGIRGAFLHIVGDMLGSIGAIAAAFVIRLTGWSQADAVVSFGIALLIILSGSSLIRESLHILLEGVPRHIRLDDVEGSLRLLEGIVDIHDLHVWRIGSNFDTLTVHLVVNDIEEWRIRRETARALLHERFGIEHCTIEVEGPGEHVGLDCSEAIHDNSTSDSKSEKGV